MNIKQYLKLIKDFYAGHALIHTVKSGNQFAFNSESKLVYPVAHIEYLGEASNDVRLTYNFLVTIADIFDPNLPESEEDIYSDSAEVCNDTISYFDNSDDEPTIQTTGIQLQKFNNGLKDKVCGHTFLLILSETRTSNACLIPLKANI